MATLGKLALACLLSLAIIQSSNATDGVTVTYWGQNLGEGTLAEACNTKFYNIINLAFLNQFGNYAPLGINLAGHCDQTSNTCTKFAGEIKACQNQGIKILISLGGAIPGPLGYTLISAEDAKKVATQIWNSFLGGTDSSSPRPLGDVVLDGVDFDIESGSNLYYDVLAANLKAYSTTEKPVYLSAAPQCPYPDHYLGPAIDTGLFDYVWVQFYNNPSCQYSAESGVQSLLDSWDQWTSELKGSEKLFLGLPASSNAANSGGYIPSNVLNFQVLPLIKDTSKYGGVMIWSRYWDTLSGYTASIISFVNYFIDLLKSVVS